MPTFFILFAQVLHCLGCQSIQGPLDPWASLPFHIKGQGGSRPNSRRGSRSDADTPMTDAQGGSSSSSGVGRLHKPPRDGGSKGGEASGTWLSPDHQADQQHDQLPGIQGFLDEQHAAASVLSGAAAGLSHRAVEKVIGYGISGPVFLHR